jgi:hypothetical protein
LEGGQPEAGSLIEGRPEPKRIVILEFADTAAVKRWYNSPEYQKILPGPARQLDQPRLHRRRRKLTSRISNGRAAPGDAVGGNRHAARPPDAGCIGPRLAGA